MVIIQLQNALSKVVTKNISILPILKELLTYTDKNAEFAYFKHLKQAQRMVALFDRATSVDEREKYQAQLRRLDFLVKKLDSDRKVSLLKGDVFPTGLLPRVLDYLDDEEIYWELDDRRDNDFEKRDLTLLKPLPELRYYQKDAVWLTLQEERGIIEAPTGTGKSMIIADLVGKIGTKAVIITPSKAISDGIYATLVEYYGKKVVGKLGSKATQTKWVNVVNIQTLVKIDPTLFTDCGTAIIDEFHHSAAATYQTVNEKHLKNCYYRIGLTATNFRNSGDDLALEGVLSNVIYRYEVKQAIEEGFLTKPSFIWVDVPGIKKASYQTEYKKSLVQNSTRNKRIAEICKRHEKDSVLVIVQEIEHGERILDLLPNAVFLTGKEDDETRQLIFERFRSGKIGILIGTNVIGEGVDLPIASVLIMAGGGKSKSQIMQNVGRVLRIHPGKNKALVYDFEDRGTKYLSAHARERAKIYEDEYVF